MRSLGAGVAVLLVACGSKTGLRGSLGMSDGSDAAPPIALDPGVMEPAGPSPSGTFMVPSEPPSPDNEACGYAGYLAEGAEVAECAWLVPEGVEFHAHLRSAVLLRLLDGVESEGWPLLPERVRDGAACAGHGWYLVGDVVHLCSTSCDQFKVLPDGPRVFIQFATSGC